MIKYRNPAALALALVVLAGCQSRPATKISTGPAARVSIEGQWRATEGPLLATFSGTDFKSVNTENDQVVAAGAFRYNSDQDIRLDWVGALSGRSSAKCKLVDPNLMSCTPSNGSGFQLRRV